MQKPNMKSGEKIEAQWAMFCVMAFLHSTCFMNAELEHSRSDLILEQPRLYVFIFQMPY